VQRRTAWANVGLVVCVALLGIGILLQITARDRLPFPVAGLYYALPRPVLLLLALLAVLLTRQSWRGAFLALAGVLGIWAGFQDFAWNPAQKIDDAERIVFWNVGHDLMDDFVVVDGFLESSPLLVGLVETGELSPEWLADWSARHPEYKFVQPHPTILLAVRSDVRAQGYASLGPHSHAAWADFACHGERLRAVVVDLAANPWVSRREPLQRLDALLDSWMDRRVLLMGDFNTPDNSVWLANIREYFQEAFRAAGSGYVPTWPWPAPVLKLDQIWVPRSMPVRRGWQQFTWRSDHRAQWAAVAIDP
jgi:endonuclease/exonuclease/phosphatase (EEP) superfamily protein YafD